MGFPPRPEGMAPVSMTALEKVPTSTLNAEQFGWLVSYVQGKTCKSNVTATYALLARHLPPDALRVICGGKAGSNSKHAFNLAASSTKVLHSGSAEGWFNVICYLSPSDMGVASFFHEFKNSAVQLNGSTHNIIESILKNVKKLSGDPDWGRLARYSAGTLGAFAQQLKKLSREPIRKDYVLPDMKGACGPFSVCPYATSVCRSVCLNTSGQGGLTRSDRFEAVRPELIALQRKYRKAVRSIDKKGKPVWTYDMPQGYTFTSDMIYFYLHGKGGFYGGASGDVIASRINRTHQMWMAWGLQGLQRNFWNDMLYLEASNFKKACDRLRVPMALRLNGTSDLPVHRLELSAATDEAGRSLSGQNLVAALGMKGIICYDYTKDYEKMMRWIAAGAWKGLDYAKSHPGEIINGWPVNYFLCFSWSEVNGKQALSVMRAGGNVVMVFRKSVESPDPLGSKSRGKKGLSLPADSSERGLYPTHIRPVELSSDPQDKEWVATVVNGDLHDLRFLDPSGLPSVTGKAVGVRGIEGGAGNVVALVAKGQAQQYTENIRKSLWQRFTIPATLRHEWLKKKQGLTSAIFAEAKVNPVRMSPKTRRAFINKVRKVFLNEAENIRQYVIQKGSLNYPFPNDPNSDIALRVAREKYGMKLKTGMEIQEFVTIYNDLFHHREPLQQSSQTYLTEKEYKARVRAEVTPEDRKRLGFGKKVPELPPRPLTGYPGIVVDNDLLNAACVKVDGWEIGTTAMGA